MDPITAIGLIASLAQIIDATTKVLRYLNDVKNAPKARAQVAQEASLLLALLTSLRYRLEDANAKDPWVQGVLTLGMASGPLDQFREALEALAAKLQGSGTAKSVGKALIWHFEKKDVDELLRRMERLKSFIGLALQGDILDIARAIKADTDTIPELRMNVLSVKDSVEKIQMAESAHSTSMERDKIITWISADKARDSFKSKLRQRQPGTGCWFIEDPSFQEWTTGRGKVLWCPGIPGAGKTILACVAMNELEEKFEGDEGKSAGCVFCDYKDIAATTPFNLIASLLSQVLSRQAVVPENVTKLYEKHEKGASRPTLDELVTLLQGLGKVKTIYIIVDALDECPDKDDSRNILLQQLGRLRGDCNILMTSRSSVSISEHFEDYLTIEITAKESDMDKYIAGHLSTRLQSHIKKNPTLYDEIKSTVIRKAKNMFLLVRLHMDSLSSKQTPNAVRKALQTLPTRVFDTYDEVLRRIEDQNEDDSRLARRILMWLSLSLRPLTMKELQHAVAIDEGLEELGEDDITSEEIIISVSAGLVSVATGEGVVQLVHYTAQEYFSQARVRNSLFSDGQRDILSCCLTYLSLDDFHDGLPEAEGDELDHFIAQHPLFYYAAHNWGHHARMAHLEESDQQMILELFQRERLLIDLIDALHIPHRGENRRFYPGILVEVDKQGVWLASYFGLLDTVKRLINNGANINPRVCLRGTVQGSRWEFNQRLVKSTRTALTVAAWNCHVSVVRLLLEHGANIQELDLNGAACKQHYEIVDLLLQNGAHGNDVGERGRRFYGSASEHIASLTDIHVRYAPIHWCAQLGNTKMTKLLLDNGASIDSKTDEGSTALILAAEKGHVEVIDLLLKWHANVEHRNALKETAMHKACWAGSTAIVRLLLEQRARFNSTDATTYERHKFENDRGNTIRHMFIHWGTDEDIREYEVLGDNTAFDYALDRGHIDIVRLFLEMDSSSVLSHISPVPLLMAAKNNSARAVEVFLQHGAQVNSQDNNGRTALFWAAVNDSEEIAGMLLRKAADVDLSDQYGATPLHMAAECGSQRVLEALVRHGASLSAKTKSTESRHSWYNSFGWGTSSQTTKCTAPSGSTPLHVAVRKAQSSRIVQILIDAGAAVDAKDDDGRTVFFVATENMNLFHLDDSELTEEWSIARLLLSRGASLNTCDNKGVTLLMKATEARNPEAVRWLLNNHTVVNVRDSKGQCAVHKVFDNYSYDEDVQGTVRRVLEILHSHGANFNTRDIEGNTPLFSAVQSNPVHALDALRQFGADVTAQNDIGSTLLHHFLDGDHWEREPDSICETTTWLLDANIPIESRNSSGETALLIAATRYYPYVVRLLANRGADMTARNHKGQTALFKCLNHYGKTEEKTEMVRTLIELGAVVNDPLGHGGDLVTAASEGPADLFDLLVTRGLNINLPDVYGSVPLVRSISRKDTTWTERLLNAGADVKATNSDGTTALHQAASYQSIANARLLVPRGSKVAQADRTGRTALHIALSTRNSALTDYLLEEWISQGSFGTEKELIYMSLESQQFGYAQRIADARDPDGRKYSINFLTELYSAAIQGSSDLVLALLRQGHDNIDQTWLIGLFRIAITLRYKDTLQALLDFGLNVDGIDFLGDAPIHIAARSEHEDLMCVLLDAHAQIETLDRSGNTPLLLAVEWGRTGTVEKLLERGANVSQANCDGDTALHLTPTSEIAEVLINAQADVNALNTRNKTPLHSQDSDSLAIAQCLLDAGANVNAKDSEGNSPLHNASLYDTRILELFLKYSPDMTLTDGKGRTPLQIAVASSDKESQAILRKYLESHTKVITSL